jgi:hypothetical protein
LPAPKAPEPLWKRGRGRPLIFETPELLWEAAEQYFEWCAANPLREEKLFAYEGCVTRDHITKMRAMTERGMCVFMGIDNTTWTEYTKRDAFRSVCERIKSIIWEQKFTAAAADLMNANIIGKELGLVERKSVEGPDGGPVQTEATLKADDNLAGILEDYARLKAGSAKPG